MTESNQFKILNDKIEVNNAQYDVDRLHAEISAYSSGNVDKYEFLTKQDLGYKPDALEQAKFEYSSLGKVFHDGLVKKDKKEGILQRLKNIEDNLSGKDNNGDEKVGLFKILKDIKNKGIKISDDDEAIREIRDHIQDLRNKDVKVSNYDEMTEEITDHIQGLEDEGIRVNIDDDQVNLVNKILKGINKKGTSVEGTSLEGTSLEDFLKKYSDKPLKTYYTDKSGKHDISTDDIHNDFADYVTKIITEEECRLMSLLMSLMRLARSKERNLKAL